MYRFSGAHSCFLTSLLKLYQNTQRECTEMNDSLFFLTSGFKLDKAISGMESEPLLLTTVSQFDVKSSSHLLPVYKQVNCFVYRAS